MINIFKTNDTIALNLMEWCEGTTRVLFIAGLSGSGKTSCARDLAELQGAKVVSLDQYYKKLIRTKTNNPNPDYKKVSFEEGVKMLLEDNPKGKLVIEGAQVAWMNPQHLKNHAIICLRTSFLTSCWRACMRDFTKEHWQKWKKIAPQIHIGFNLRNFSDLKEFASKL